MKTAIMRMVWLLLCGCGHDRITFPQKDHGVDYQRCLQCGARRKVEFGGRYEELAFGRWERAELPAMGRMTLVSKTKHRPKAAPAA